MIWEWVETAVILRVQFCRNNRTLSQSEDRREFGAIGAIVGEIHQYSCNDTK